MASGLEVRDLDLVPSSEIADAPDEGNRGTTNDEDSGEVGDRPQARDEHAIDFNELGRGQAEHNQPEPGSQPGQEGPLVGQMGSRPAVWVSVTAGARFAIPLRCSPIGAPYVYCSSMLTMAAGLRSCVA
jgi:hypothetical protein